MVIKISPEDGNSAWRNKKQRYYQHKTAELVQAQEIAAQSEKQMTPKEFFAHRIAKLEKTRIEFPSTDIDHLIEVNKRCLSVML